MSTKEFLRYLANQLRAQGWSYDTVRAAEDAADNIELHQARIRAQTVESNEAQWLAKRRLMRAQAEKPDKQGGLPEDQLTFLNKAAERGDDIAKKNLALLKDAESGNIVSQYRLGIVLLTGQGGIRPDPERARAWLHEAADRGHGLAQYALGRMFEDGIGVVQNPWQAKRWYQKAIDQGVREAWEAKWKLEKREEEQERAERKAFIDNQKIGDFGIPIIEPTTHGLRFEQVRKGKMTEMAKWCKSLGEYKDIKARGDSIKSKEDAETYVRYLMDEVKPAGDRCFKALIELREYEYEHRLEKDGVTDSYEYEEWQKAQNDYEKLKTAIRDSVAQVREKWCDDSQVIPNTASQGDHTGLGIIQGWKRLISETDSDEKPSKWPAPIGSIRFSEKPKLPSPSDEIMPFTTSSLAARGKDKPSEQRLLDIKEVAKRLSVSVRTVQRLVARGELKPVRNVKPRQFHLDVVEALIRRRRGGKTRSRM